MHHSQVEGTEVLVEREVVKVLVDIEEKSVLEVLGRFGVGYPIQLV